MLDVIWSFDSVRGVGSMKKMLSLLAPLVLLLGSTVSAQDYDPIVVAVWSGPEHDNLVKVAAEYTAQTGNEVIIDEIARETLQTRVNTVLLSGADDYDVIYVSADWIPQYAQAGLLAPLNPFIDSIAADWFSLDALSPSVDSLTIDGSIYGFPSEGDTAWLFYRTDLLEAAGLDVPQTWEEFREAAIAMTQDENGDGRPEVYGAVIGAKRDEAFWDFMHVFYGFGGQILDADGKVAVNNETGVAALTFYSNLLLQDQVVPPDVTTYGYNEILTALQQGRVAMAIQWMAGTQTLLDCEQSPLVCDKLDYTLLPGTLVDGELQRGFGASQWAWVIPAASGNKEGAYKFIEWLTGPEGAKLWALNGGIPSNSIALSDPEVVERVPQFGLLAEAMPYRNLMPATTVTAELLDAMMEASHNAVTGAVTPQEALDAAAARMAKALAEAGYTQ
jgi:ABC-type glycerol-3-phosphate transport system substrate-binding protein